MDAQNVSRRGFMKDMTALGVAGTLAGCATSQQSAGPLSSGASRKFKVALIGCGHRGNGALGQSIAAAKLVGVELEVIATADVFKEKAFKTGREHGTPEAHCFDGFSGYKKVLELPVDIVLLATSPNFRPVHLEAAVAAGKHVFMEKPVAVDPPGVRRVLAAGAVAKQKGLTIVAGTQRRHQEGYLKIAKALQDGRIGELVGGRVLWCGSPLWIKEREPGEDDAHYLVRNWVNFAEMSGDHICEQHVHNIDVANWMLGRTPVSAMGFGGRVRRKTGNQYNFFNVDFDYGNEVHIHSMCRQIGGCYQSIMEQFVGTKGSTFGGSNMRSLDGHKIELPEIKMLDDDPYVQEHADLLNSVLKNEGLNEAQNVAQSTLAGILGRIAAYTGQLVRWSDVMEHADSPYYNLTLLPTADDFEKGAVVAPQDDVAPVPGKEDEPKKETNKKGKRA